MPVGGIRLETELASPSNKDGIRARRERPAASAAPAPLKAASPFAFIRPSADHPILIEHDSEQEIPASIEHKPGVGSPDAASIERPLKRRPNLIESYRGACDCQPFLARMSA